MTNKSEGQREGQRERGILWEHCPLASTTRKRNFAQPEKEDTIVMAYICKVTFQNASFTENRVLHKNAYHIDLLVSKSSTKIISEVDFIVHDVSKDSLLRSILSWTCYTMLSRKRLDLSVTLSNVIINTILE